MTFSHVRPGRLLRVRIPPQKDKKKATMPEGIAAFLIGSGGGIRTPDQPVNSRLLYH